ncbi:hypothetical protein GTW69_20475, partial [Streptomyces sp. SID7760]|nr:hypothetical protein [Streptomyces sp. SID7760]
MKTSKYRAVPLAVGLALATAIAVPATAQPHTLPELRGSATGRIVLTNLDDGRNLPVVAGDDIEVRLTGGRAGGLSWAWGEPAASDPAILARTASNAMPNGNATAV